MRTGTRTLLVVAITAVAAMAAGGAAQAAIPVTGLTAKPADAQAGGHADFTLAMTFGGTEHARNLTIHLPAGLIGNPTKVASCSTAQFDKPSTAANACPAASAVGSTSVAATATILLVPSPITAEGKVYVLKPHAGEIARLGIDVMPTGAGAVVGQHIRLQSGITVRKETDAGLDSSLVLSKTAPSSLGDLPVRIDSMSLTLNASAGGHPFMSNPTSCHPAVTTVDVTSYESPGVNHATTSFTPTGCDKEALTPAVSATVIGSHAPQGRPAVRVVTSQPEGQAALKRVVVALPSAIENSASLAEGLQPCTAQQDAAHACPAASVIGKATAQTPVLSAPLVGDVHLAFPAGAGLPVLSITLQPLGVTVHGSTDFNSEGGIVTTFDGLPDTPLTRFQLDFTGGARGILANGPDLCAVRPLRVTGSFLGHNGGVASAATNLTVSGCGAVTAPRPKATARFSHLGGKRAGLTVSVKAAATAPKLRRVRIALPSGVKVSSLAKRLVTVSRGAKVKASGHSALQVRSSGARSLKVTLKRGALTSTRKAKQALRLTVTDAKGHVTHLRITAKRH